MIERARGWRRGWHERSRLQRIDLYTRVTLCSMSWVFLLTWGLLPLGATLDRGGWAMAVGGMVLAVNAALAVLSNLHVTPALAHYRGARPFPLRRLRLPAALLAVLAGLVVVLTAIDGLGDEDGDTALLAMDVPVSFAVVYVLLVPARRYVAHSAAFIAAFVALLAAVGGSRPVLVGAAVSMVVSTLLVLLSVRPSGWSLSVMWQAEEARDTQARLAVAEERLRFGRDMHDVLGRNLAVIALKSELAMELAQRGNPAAVDQMVEVQRIARASQQEVRDVVRGYREADLPTELLGAQGVLRAAGIACTVEGADGPAGLGAPAAVQAALGWVVREAATNVLRHGDPRRCSIRLTRTREAVVLEVENDGAGSGATGSGDRDPEASGQAGGGSGLAGLRERLGALGGSLRTAATDDGLFRVTATVPVTAAPSRGRSSPSPAASEPGGLEPGAPEPAAPGPGTPPALPRPPAPTTPPAPPALPEER
ncbi:sensor histidine kinase [Streptomyces pratensis]|uniref:sensor histidine kinase n=1 Tax=Streptomyces pratensis TaxID=1169025 RepID=UPI0030190B09